MKTFSKIKTLRLEVDPINGNYAGQANTPERNKDVITKVRAQIKRANTIGLNVILTYHNHKFNGSDNEADLLTAATWWKENYAKLRGSGLDRKNRAFRINLSNEWGNSVNHRQYYEAYNKAISIVREVYNYNIVIDCPGYGGGTRRAIMAYPFIKDKNITFSIHIYPRSFNKSRTVIPADIEALSKAVGADKCIMGEFGNSSRQFIKDTPEDLANWKLVIKKAKELKMPILAWAWNGHGSKEDGDEGNGIHDLNMMNPSWEENSNTKDVKPSKYFYIIYDLL